MRCPSASAPPKPTTARFLATGRATCYWAVATVTAGLSAKMLKLPAQLRKTLTWDRGREPAGHKGVTAATGLDVYFADPRSPWQRGTKENTDRLRRQHLPRKRPWDT
ncbi:hypothetical protein ABT168_34680 [Streptomyces sp. NPDC001793]|uniref:hypothetical protein n=1 Tax=Streptomyces sp. NPDC001793 TaxID=3154657 RepID=UPI00332C24D4